MSVNRIVKMTYSLDGGSPFLKDQYVETSPHPYIVPEARSLHFRSHAIGKWFRCPESLNEGESEEEYAEGQKDRDKQADDGDSTEQASGTPGEPRSERGTASGFPDLGGKLFKENVYTKFFDTYFHEIPTDFLLSLSTLSYPDDGVAPPRDNDSATAGRQCDPYALFDGPTLVVLLPPNVLKEKVTLGRHLPPSVCLEFNVPTAIRKKYFTKEKDSFRELIDACNAWLADTLNGAGQDHEDGDRRRQRELIEDIYSNSGLPANLFQRMYPPGTDLGETDWLDKWSWKDLIAELNPDPQQFEHFVTRMCSPRWPPTRGQPEVDASVITVGEELWEVVAPLTQAQGTHRLVRVPWQDPLTLVVVRIVQDLSCGWHNFDLLPSNACNTQGDRASQPILGSR